MKDEDFKKIDGEWMKKLTPLRQRPINPKLLEGFAASVERRIRLAQEEPARKPSIATAWKIAVPAMAACALAIYVAVQAPQENGGIGVVSPTIEVAQTPPADGEAALTQEIEELRELGAWTFEDEKTAGVALSEEEELAETGA